MSIPTRPNFYPLGVPSNVESYAKQVADMPLAYIARTASGKMVGTVAYSLEQATHNLVKLGGDVTTIEGAAYHELLNFDLHDVAETYVDECQSAHECAIAEAQEHYGD